MIRSAVTSRTAPAHDRAGHTSGSSQRGSAQTIDCRDALCYPSEFKACVSGPKKHPLADSVHPRGAPRPRAPGRAGRSKG